MEVSPDLRSITPVIPFAAADVLNVTDALQAHAHCKACLQALLRSIKPGGFVMQNFTPDPQCPLGRFIDECERVLGETAQTRHARQARATMHTIAIGLAQKQAAGQKIDIDSEFSAHGTFGVASVELFWAIWHLDDCIHPIARRSEKIWEW